MFATHSHLVIDEIHERSTDTDLLCYFARRLLDLHPHLRLVLMSATLCADLYQEYFDVDGLGYGDGAWHDDDDDDNGDDNGDDNDDEGDGEDEGGGGGRRDARGGGYLNEALFVGVRRFPLTVNYLEDVADSCDTGRG